MQKISYKRAGAPTCSVEAKKLTSGESLEMYDPIIKDKSRVSFTCDISSFGDGAMIAVGRGYNFSNGAWVEITKDRVCAYKYYSYSDPKLRPIEPQAEHGLSLEGPITIIIEENYREKHSITVSTEGGSVTFDSPAFHACDGKIFAMAQDCELEGCRLDWDCDGFDFPIWIYGDSYLGHTSPARWPYYLYRDGYDNVLLAGYPGMGSTRAIEDFKNSLEHGTPKVVLWCLGMNNRDESDEVPNAAWLAATEEFIALCEEKGITPVLSTIPRIPTRNNVAKNAWVRASGYRYVDFNFAVGAHEDVAWYPEMLSADGVHPDVKGGVALYEQVLTDFPEIKNK